MLVEATEVLWCVPSNLDEVQRGLTACRHYITGSAVEVSKLSEALVDGCKLRMQAGFASTCKDSKFDGSCNTLCLLKGST